MRRNGHYSYTGLPTTWFPHPPPLSVKNANLVRRWLEDSFGLTLLDNKSDMITIHALPKFTEDDVRQRIGLKPIGQGELLEDRSRKYTSGVLAEPRRVVDAETGVRPSHCEGGYAAASPRSSRVLFVFLTYEDFVRLYVST